MKKITPKQYAICLYEIAKGLKDLEISEKIKKFVKILIKTNALRFLDRIVKEFIKYYNQREKIIKIEIKSAKKLENNLEKKIIEKFKRIKGIENIDFKKEVDKSLIGGLIVKIEDLVIDGSLKKKLEKIKEHLI